MMIVVVHQLIWFIFTPIGIYGRYPGIKDFFSYISQYLSSSYCMETICYYMFFVSGGSSLVAYFLRIWFTKKQQICKIEQFLRKYVGDFGSLLGILIIALL